MAQSTHTHEHPNYVLIWYWLLGLALVSVLLSALPIPQAVTLFLIFAAACVKAVLVALYYMHLRFERTALVVSLVGATLATAAVLFFLLVPDGMAMLRLAPH